MTDQVRILLCSTLGVVSADRTLHGGDLGTRKARTLLALLASQRGRQVPLDEIAEVLWPHEAPADPAANIATLVSRTRRLVGRDVLRADGRTYGLVRDMFTTDLDEAVSLTAEASDRVAAGEPTLATVAARRALDLLGTADALPDEADSEWVLAVRREADDLRRQARHVLARAATPIEPSAAVVVATESVARDPYDERAVRDLMRAHVADDGAAAALSSYDALAVLLREELGIDPDLRTSSLRLAILREEELAPEDSEPPASRPDAVRSRIVGREDQLALVNEHWLAASGSAGSLLLVDGEAGMGKSHLLAAAADLAAATGGLVLGTRCHPTERSLFLQPFVDTLRPVLLTQDPAGLNELVGEHAAAWASMVPEVSRLVPVAPPDRSSPDVERRRSYDAVAAVLRKLGLRRPVLLSVDDLQEGGAATVDLLGYLAGRLTTARVLVIGAVRTEDDATLHRLADRATRLHVGALPPSAVHALATAAGLASRADELIARTSGHSLSVVECIRSLAAGDDGVPSSLSAAVSGRVRRLDGAARDLVQGGAVLGGRLDPRLAGRLDDHGRADHSAGL